MFLNKRTKTIVELLVVLMLSGCAFEPVLGEYDPGRQDFVDYVTMNAFTGLYDEYSDCKTVKHYPYQERTESVFVDEYNNQYDIILDVENTATKKINAYELGHLASFIVAEHKKFDLPKHNEVIAMLSRGRFIILDDDQIFDSLIKKENPEGYCAFIDVGDAQKNNCFSNKEQQLQGTVNWTAIVRTRCYDHDNVNVFLHEMMHATSKAVYGDTDTDHTRVWLFGIDTKPFNKNNDLVQSLLKSSNNDWKNYLEENK